MSAWSERPVALDRNAGPSVEPLELLGGEATEVGEPATVVLPDVEVRLSVAPERYVGEQESAEEQHLVVAEQTADVAVALERHRELDRAEPVRAAIDQITEEPELRVRSRPALLGVQEPGVLQERHEHVAVPVDVTDHEDRGSRTSVS